MTTTTTPHPTQTTHPNTPPRHPHPLRSSRRQPAPLRTVSEPEGIAGQMLGQGEVSSQFIPCPKCEKHFVSAALVRGKPEFAPEWRHHIVQERLYCDHCDAVFLWDRKCDPSGMKLDRIVSTVMCEISSPGYVDRFLRAHPEARGVEHTERP